MVHAESYSGWRQGGLAAVIAFQQRYAFLPTPWW